MDFFRENNVNDSEYMLVFFATFFVTNLCVFANVRWLRADETKSWFLLDMAIVAAGRSRALQMASLAQAMEGIPGARSFGEHAVATATGAGLLSLVVTGGA